MKHILAIVFLFSTQLIFGQQIPRPIIVKDPVKIPVISTGILAGSNAIYTQDFETATSLVSAGISVKTKATDGGFKIGNASAASSGQVWKVTTHTKFVFTNDDVCNCNKSADSLILPVQNLLGSKVYQLRFNAYFNSISSKEMAYVLVKNNGTTTLLSPIKSDDGWQDYVVPLKGLIGNTEIVFTYTDGGLWGTGLALDDIFICEPDESINLGMEEVWFNGLNTANAYKDYPRHQVAKMPLKIESDLINLGKNTATNAKVNFSIQGLGALSESSTPISLDANADSLVTIHNSYIPAGGIGNYKMLFVTESDSAETERSTDSAHFDLNITDTIFSRIGEEKSTSGFWFGPKMPYDLSSLVEIATPDSANSISVFINGNSVVGDTFDLIILNEFFQDNVVPQVFPPVGTLIEVTKKHLGKWNTFKIPTTYLKPGKYYVGIRTYNGKVLVGVSESTAQSGISFVNIGTGYASSNYLPFIKLNLKPRICSLTATVSTKKSICGGSTGVGSIAVVNGTSPFTYQWGKAAGGSTSNTVTGLNSGVYGVTVTDSLGCAISSQVSISDTNGSTITLKNIANENCFGDLTGSISIAASNGSAPYSFNWSNGQTDSTIQNLGTGTYRVTVSDISGNGCKTVAYFDVLGPEAPLSIDFVVEDNVCFNDTLGSVRVNVNGGVPNYKYAWSDTSIKSNVNRGLISGMYLVTVTDTNGCELIDSVQVKGSVPIVLNLNFLDTGNLGIIKADVVGGKQPLTYNWVGPAGYRSPGTKDLEELFLRGIYTLEVTDADGCIASGSGEIAGIVGDEELKSEFSHTLFPNPAKNETTLKFNTKISGEYVLYDLIGNVILKDAFVEQNSIQILKPKSGIYLLDVTTDASRFNYKLIFQD